MSGALALLAAASTLAGAPPTLDRSHLPVLPERGLARDVKAGVELQTMGGRPIGVLPRLNLAPDMATSRILVMRDGRGSLYVLDRRARSVRRISHGPPPRRACRVTDRRAHVQLVVCRRAIKTRTESGRLRVVAGAPVKTPAGHWERAMFSPSGGAFLAQWIAECEVPVAYLIVDGKFRRYGSESVALGWLARDVTVIHFLSGPCGGGGRRPRGIYAVPRSGKPHLLLRTSGFASYLMWGG